MKHFVCSECGTAQRVPVRTVQRYRGTSFRGNFTFERVPPFSAAVPTIKCRRCGDTYDVSDSGDVSRRDPALHMQPVDHSSALKSIWMPTHTRPIRTGIYECRFRHIEPNIVPLLWNGVTFLVPTTGERVVMTQFLTWRGCFV